jgi:transmembrane sensor
MKQDIDWDLILRYLTGTANQTERDIFNRWLNASVKNENTFNQIKQIWNTADSAMPTPNLTDAWLKIKQRAGIEETYLGNALPSQQMDKKSTVLKLILGSRLLRVAAVLILFIVTSYLLFKIPIKSEMNNFQVSSGDIQTINLVDGSKIILDAGSTLRFPEKFTGNRREVHLNGEGFFEIFPDPDKPFTIHTNNAVITVLGTAFNIRAWQQYNETIVAVAQGKVSLRQDNKSKNIKEITITKNQLSILKEDENPTPPQNININDFTSWQQRQMYFKSVPLQEVLDQLERWYGLEFELPDESAGSNRVTIYIENKSIPEILDIIALINNYQYILDGKKVIFTLNEQNLSDIGGI